MIVLYTSRIETHFQFPQLWPTPLVVADISVARTVPKIDGISEFQLPSRAALNTYYFQTMLSHMV